jgi:tetratricopeptide (TPR) repeat protein
MKTNLIHKTILGLLISSTLLIGCGKDNDKEKPAQDVKGLLDRASAYEKNGQYRAAFIELKNALKADPVNIPAKLQISKLYLTTGQPKSASLALESIKPIPSSSEYIDLYAETLNSQEKYKSTLQFIEKNKSQCSSRCLSLKGDALLATKDSVGAEKSYIAAQQADKNNVAASLGLIKTYYQEKQTDKADALLAETLQQHADNTDTLLLKASLLMNAGKQAEAEEILNKALFTLPSTDVITPKRIVIIENLVDILTLQGRTEDALTYSKMLTDLDPKGSELRNMMDEAIALYTAKDYDGARKILEKINQEASNGKVQTLLGVIDYMKGDFQAASNLLEGNVNLDNSTATTKSILINSYLSTGQTQKALDFLSNDYQLNGNDIDVINLYANTLMRTGDSDKAYPLMQKSLTLKAITA